MATYVISDIHGQLDKFKEMLNIIDFKFDGSYELHILGDMIDWGNQSLETLLYCKDLAEKYSFIHVYRGNHEDMMLEDFTDEHNNLIDVEQWHYNNGINGNEKTYYDFSRLDKSRQENIIEFLKQLPYFNDNVEVNGQKFYLAHAAPYTDMPNDITQMYKRHQWHSNGFHFVIWHRFEEQEQSFRDKKYKDYILIHGHTPTMIVNDEGLCVIHRTRDRICIDTGAKMMSRHEDYPEYRLCCLRLDDLDEFYVSY